jgi:hypothetical protein
LRLWSKGFRLDKAQAKKKSLQPEFRAVTDNPIGLH